MMHRRDPAAPQFRVPTYHVRALRAGALAVVVMLVLVLGAGLVGGGCTVAPTNAVAVFGGPGESAVVAPSVRTVGINVTTRRDRETTVRVIGKANPVLTAAAQQAAVTAIMLTGTAPERTRIDFVVGHASGGLSSGAALAVGVLATLRGDHVAQDIAILGTIRPDGGIGAPADSLATDAAARKAGVRRIIVPPDTPLSAADTNGTVKLVVAPDIWTAYAAATGTSLPRRNAPAIGPTSDRYDAVMRPRTAAHAAAARAALAEATALPAPARQSVDAYLATATTLLAQADAPDAGTGGAARMTLLALGYARGAVDAGHAAVTADTSSPAEAAAALAEPTGARVRSAISAAAAEVGSAVARSANDANARIGANVALTDALSLATLSAAALAERDLAPQVLRDQVLGAQVAAALAEVFSTAAVDDVAAQSGPGAPIAGRVDDVALAGMFRRAGDANAALVVPPATGVARLNRAIQDPGIATALTGGRAVLTLQLLATSDQAQRWANLGASLALYSETADLLSGNGGTDTARANAFAQSRLGGAIWSLLGSGIDASGAIAANQQARVDAATSDPTVARAALGLRWRTLLGARTAAFVGGVPETGPGAA